MTFFCYAVKPTLHFIKLLIVMNVTVSIKVSFGWKFVLNNKAYVSLFLKRLTLGYTGSGGSVALFRSITCRPAGSMTSLSKIIVY